jgi:membrane protein YdbS with pleckstrin-like domain
MINQQITDYIRQNTAQGIALASITTALVGAGWNHADIDDSIRALGMQTTRMQQAYQPVTENNYPIQTAWIYKSVVAFIGAVIVSILMVIFGFYNTYLIFIILYTPINIILTIVRRKNFHYALEEKFLILRQGVFSKQQRTLPYGVIQNVFVKQDLFDRLFGLASLAIENSAQGGGKSRQSQMKASSGNKTEMLGFGGNKINIPGLNAEDAEKLKLIVLERIKANPIENYQSGL